MQRIDESSYRKSVFVYILLVAHLLSANIAQVNKQLS